MGVSFVVTISALFTTVVVYLYLSVLEQETFFKDVSTSRQQPCRADENYHVPRIRESFMLPVADGSPTKILRFNQIPLLYKKRNNAVIGAGIGSCIKTCNEPNKLVLVTNVISVFDHFRTLQYLKRPPTNREMQARTLEFLNTLQYNLNHPQIKVVVALVESKTMVRFLATLDFKNSQKLIIHNVGGELSMVHAITYATECFQGETIAIANGDITFGDGWGNLDYKYLRKSKHMYALTRHDSNLNPKCTGNTKFGICKGIYYNSHDAFVFHVREKIRKDSLSVLDKRLYNIFGVENILISMFREQLHYKVTNPCSLLKIHHEHCVSIRNLNAKKTVDDGGMVGTAGFINTLY